MKPERKQLLEEWEAKLNEFAHTGAENQRADEKAAKAKKRASRRHARTKLHVEDETGRYDLAEDNGDKVSDTEAENNGTVDNKSMAKKRAPRRVRRRKQPEAETDQEEVSDVEIGDEKENAISSRRPFRRTLVSKGDMRRNYV